ncbi:MAG TPA: hypothetical protein VLB80_00300 [Candidatus Babeliales bacterium]|nr:hypothetical protein [Candidatus Babeliales bacterium]
MKNNMKIISIIIVVLSVMSLAAYENSFFNNTNEPIGIAIQYTSNDGNEPLYKQIIKPKTTNTFTPGKGDIPAIKWGFCLDNLYYAKNPTSEQKANNFEKTLWKKVPITWTDIKSTTKLPQSKQIKKESLQKQPATALERKSLCRDRHFDITYDQYGAVSVTSSLQD